jgi:hypothetical protein
MNEPLRITISTYGARPHQSGRGPGNESGKHFSYFGYSEKEPNPHGPVVEHVRDGKALTAVGRKLLGIRPPSTDHARQNECVRPGEVL